MAKAGRKKGQDDLTAVLRKLPIERRLALLVKLLERWHYATLAGKIPTAEQARKQRVDKRRARRGRKKIG